MSTIASVRIPVYDSEGVIIDRVEGPRARRLALAPNATVVRKRLTGALRRRGQRGEIVRILLKSDGDETMEYSRHGNARSYSHNHETETNPENCWTLKRIPTETADIFRTVVNELAA